MTDPTVQRRRIADYLADHGPTHGDKLAEALGMTLEEFWPLINHPWFDLARGGYDLTAEGRTAAAGEQP